MCAFDTIVNCGPRGYQKIVQDWMRDGDQTINGFLNARIAYYMGLIAKNPKLGKFKKGWLNRVNDLKKFIDIHSQEEEGA